MNLLLPLLLILFLLSGCIELPLTDRRQFDPELEKRERDLMLRRDFATGEEKRLIEKDLDRIQNNYIFSVPKDVLERPSSAEEKTESNNVVNDKIMKELERSSKESQRNKSEQESTQQGR
ncbi:MAG: hypothetical protein HGB32_07395 [Geobacteraceae bacterium]|nr:hypothetical protein [Geobacteraceae bacterium]NTW79956.1 hypothetical protein [Geobacteraceae bacterium]